VLIRQKIILAAKKEYASPLLIAAIYGELSQKDHAFKMYYLYLFLIYIKKSFFVKKLILPNMLEN
jgi:hypothetical protein